MAGYLALKGLQILRNGYNVIPIKPAAKFPVLRNWQNHLTKPADITSWLSNGHAEAGVGITTGKTVFVDLDTPDLGDALYMEGFIQFTIGFAPVRIGNNPKRGLMFRTDTPFRKITSKTYVDSQGREHRCEILGIGQQFVSHHIHPDTGKPYLWQQGDGPEHVHIDDLPLITEEQAREIVAVFEKRMVENGFKAKGAVIPANALPRAQQYTVDDELGLERERLWLSEDVLAAKVRSIPNADEVPYGDDSNTEQLGWFKLLCAIHHETGGSEFGRSLAYEWSIQAPKHTDERFDSTWPSLGQRNQGEREITGRYITRWARVFERQRAAEQLPDLLLRLDIAGSIGELTEVINECRKIVLDPLNQGQLITCIQQNAKRFRSTLTMKQVRALIKPEKIEVPDWLKGWVYLKHSTEFYHRDTGERINREAFDAAYGRHVPEGAAALYALDTVKIPVFHMTMYLPAAETVFTDASGLEWINTYRNLSPKMPAKLEGENRRNVEIVRQHFNHLIEDPRDAQLLISTLAYIVQTGKRVNYMTVLQGAEGIGKTFIADMMSAVLGGAPHIHKLDTNLIVNGNHTDWAEGHQFSFIEELWIPGHRFDVINKMKVYITDAAISVHPKYVKQYNAVNTASYLGFTNRRDAIPLDGSDTRYYIILSRWQSTEEANKFKAENPTYYPNLFRAIKESPGAIYGWLKAYKLHPEFNPVGRAPHSKGKIRLIDEQRSDLQIAIEDLIEDGNLPGISEDLIVVHLLVEALERMDLYSEPKFVVSILKQLQFTPVLGRRVKMSNPRRDFYCWSKNREIISAGVSQLHELVIQKVIYYDL